MRVFQIMAIDVGFCRPCDELSRAAAIMWEKDCGLVPVVDDDFRVVGVVTDRDIAIACASRNARPSEIRTGEMGFREIETCRMEDELSDVLKRMARIGIRRMPVTGDRGELLGLISIADVLRDGDKKLMRQAAKALAKIAGRKPSTESADQK